MTAVAFPGPIPDGPLVQPLAQEMSLAAASTSATTLLFLPRMASRSVSPLDHGNNDVWVALLIVHVQVWPSTTSSERRFSLLLV